ncbi:WapI family immunity protein [Desulfopila aestuarii]|uniref:Immunity protein 42 n=1 Tax=Desulfopila aestuarii DSM 18488 TaxID=1121416 RepID=A0A1M7Y9A0_9BACT|nr:hypothetical protein [Desulfopila aestuarii]SHO49213.1 hypothetical protein SAMN02745220_02735 [Desulfopila aestuarii DSM 18488]
MIEFADPSKQLKFSFGIERYEYPDITSGFDANWLMINIKVNFQDKEFCATDPALLTCEAQDIFNWFQSISNDRIPRRTHLGFLEQLFHFELLGRSPDCIQYAIHLDDSFKPDFAIGESGEDFIMIFDHTEDCLRGIARQLKKEIGYFPMRGDSNC